MLLWKHAGYEVGKDYVYHYNGKLQVQNPEQPLQSSGFAFRSKVVAQPRPDHTHFKVKRASKVKKCVHGHIPHRKPRSVVDVNENK